eukprot:TRINITY_DN67474_c0_g1_i1.p1 TRINITY_DN67474_c0_g1~~TRINITY_DN67474_c0_g1_i1.p1  ORF type:complete len:384 (+),score=58.55 TRINITY_DN67474_c0_g1_i1:80-1153(+)
MEVKWGILGCARIARKFCLSVAGAGNARIVAVASRSKEKAEAFANEHCPGVKCYGSYEELLADDEVQAVYVPLPSGVRTELAMKAAAAKKHILLEKPQASTADLRKVIDACASNGVQLMDNTMFMHHDRLEAMTKVINDPEVFGKCRHVTSSFTIPYGTDPAWLEGNIRTKPDLEPLGCLGDLGWYCVRFSLWAFNYENPTAVSCTFVEQTDEGVPTHLVGNVRFSGGRTASMSCSFFSAFYNSAEVLGERRVLRVDDFIVPYDSAAGYTVTSTSIKSKVVNSEEVRGCVQHAKLVKNFSEIVTSGKLEGKWPTQALQTQGVLDAMLRSARLDGKWVECSECQFECAESPTKRQKKG